MTSFVFVGDIEVLPIVLDMIMGMPRPVADPLFREAAILVTGWSTEGWATSARFADRGGVARTKVVTISAASRDPALIRHYVGQNSHPSG